MVLTDSNGIKFSLPSKAGTPIITINNQAPDTAGNINISTGNTGTLPTLATVATSGSFTDLKNKPTTLSGYGITDAALLIPSIGSKTANYSLSIGDAGGDITVDSSKQQYVFVPTNSTVPFKINTKINIYQLGTGTLTISGADSTVKISSFENKTSIAGQFAGATLIKVGVNQWLLVGNLK